MTACSGGTAATFSKVEMGSTSSTVGPVTTPYPRASMGAGSTVIVVRII